MTTFTSGLVIGEKDVCIFSITPLSEMNQYHASDLGIAMAYLSDKVNQDPENLKEVIDIHARLFNSFRPNVYVELERPLHIGIRSIIDDIRMTRVPVKPYFRQE